MEPFEEGFGPESWPALNVEERKTLRDWFLSQVAGIQLGGKSHDKWEIRTRLQRAMEADPEIMELFLKSVAARAAVDVLLEKGFPSKEKPQDIHKEEEG